MYSSNNEDYMKTVQAAADKFAKAKKEEREKTATELKKLLEAVSWEN